MNMPNPTMAGQPRPRSQSWGRPIGIVASYALLGPFLGAFSVNGLFAVYAVGVEIARGDFSDIARLFWGGIVMGTALFAIGAYAFGSISAVAVGLAVAFRDRRKGGISWRTALVVALIVWLLMSIAVTAVVPPEGLVRWVGALLVAHVLATVVCTWIVRRIFR